MEIRSALSHVHIPRPIQISGCITVPMNGTVAQHIGFYEPRYSFYRAV